MTITGSAFTNNQAQQGQAFYGTGGAIDSENSTSLTVSNSNFTDNSASGSIFASGGAVFSFAGSLAFSNCRFAGTQAISGSSSVGPGATAFGGAIDSDVGTTLTVSNTSFLGNRAVGGAGAAGSQGGTAQGGGIIVQNSSTATVNHCLFVGNQSVGGAGSVGGASVGETNTLIFGNFASTSNDNIYGVVGSTC